MKPYRRVLFLGACLLAPAVLQVPLPRARAQEVEGRSREQMLQEAEARRRSGRGPLGIIPAPQPTPYNALPPQPTPQQTPLSPNEEVQKLFQNRMRVADEQRKLRDTAVRAKEDLAKSVAKEIQGASPQSLTLKNVSDLSVLNFDPPDYAPQEGERFLTHLALSCQTRQTFDSVDLIIAYDPAFIAPEKVHDDALRPLLKSAPQFSVDAKAGLIFYKGELKQPAQFYTHRLLTIVWRALRPVDHTEIGLGIPERRSSVRLGAKDLLVDELLTEGAVIPAGVSVVARKSNFKQGFIPPGPGAAYAVAGFSKGPVWLELEGPATTVPAGETFDVAVHLRNPQKVPFDLVSLYIRYPLDRVEIRDWDKGNWIRIGVNVHDGSFHEEFPFDFHFANEVDSKAGTIFYRMGMTSGRVSDEGAVVEISARALAPVSVKDFQFLYGPADSARTTEVSFLGTPLLVERPADKAVEPGGNMLPELPPGR